jgi:predicted O-methyltransferase YrrM
MEERWAEVDAWFEKALVQDDVEVNGEGLPQIAVSALQGKLLALLVATSGAQSVLEIGTLGGYSTIWLARGGAERIVTLESNAKHADVARASFERAGLTSKIDLRLGSALETLPKLEGPFDFVFIDADKKNNAEYLAHALRLAKPGTLIVVDNVARGGAVIDGASTDPNVIGTRAFVERLAKLGAEGRLDATAIQTVGSKGWDGFVVARVRAVSPRRQRPSRRWSSRPGRI